MTDNTEGESRSALQKRWDAFDAGLARAEGVFIVLLLGVMVGVGFLQVILRNFFHTGIFSADLLLRQGLLWLALAGASLASRGEGRHIDIDILSRMMPARWAKWTRRLTDLFAAGVCTLLAYAGWLFMADEWAAGSRIAGLFPAWGFQLVLPAGFGLMGLRFLAAAWFGRPPPTEELPAQYASLGAPVPPGEAEPPGSAPPPGGAQPPGADHPPGEAQPR